MQKDMKKIGLISLLRLIPILYGIMFFIVLLLLLFFSGTSYAHKRYFLISNIFVLIPFFIISVLFYKFYKDRELKDTLFKKIVIGLSIVTFILQIILTTHIYFYSDWDVEVIRELVNTFIKTGSLKEDFYLTVYPNNILITFFLSLIKKIPFLGKYYITTLVFNALLVNMSGVFTTLAIKNLKDCKAALISYIIMLPLILLSPWISIPYSDTFALPCVTLIMYLYTKERNPLDYLLIGFISIIGFKLKPTVIIILIAIFIVEFISNFKNINKLFIKKILRICCVFIIGALLGLSVVKIGEKYLRFEPNPGATEITFIHYLAMGQNDETLGSYSQEDVDDTIMNGRRYDLNKFKERVLNRNFYETIVFYSKKTLLNFNDGTFSWGVDGTFFYKMVKAPNKFAKFLRQFYYDEGKYYNLFLQVQNYLWLLVLLFCPFIIKKVNNKKELVIMLSIIGLVLFLTIFEPRTRYMYCYSEIYVMAAILGLYNLKDIIKFLIEKKKVKSQRY